jgi:hypothetical protein
MNPGLAKEAARRSVAQHAVEARFAEAARPEEVEAAISRLEKEGAQALIVLVSQMFLVERRRIIKLASTRRWPVVAGQREWARGLRPWSCRGQQPVACARADHIRRVSWEWPPLGVG